MCVYALQMVMALLMTPAEFNAPWQLTWKVSAAVHWSSQGRISHHSAHLSFTFKVSMTDFEDQVKPFGLRCPLPLQISLRCKAMSLRFFLLPGSVGSFTFGGFASACLPVWNAVTSQHVDGIGGGCCLLESFSVSWLVLIGGWLHILKHSAILSVFYFSFLVLLFYFFCCLDPKNSKVFLCRCQCYYFIHR